MGSPAGTAWGGGAVLFCSQQTCGLCLQTEEGPEGAAGSSPRLVHQSSDHCGQTLHQVSDWFKLVLLTSDLSVAELCDL